MIAWQSEQIKIPNAEMALGIFVFIDISKLKAKNLLQMSQVS